MEYISEGSGDPMILLHGFCETSSIWHYLIPVLKDHFHLLVPDLPGFGQSPLLRETVDMEFYANAIIQLMDQERILQAHLVGHSMGGYIGLAIAEKFPDRISSFTLLHSTPLADSEQRKINRNRTVDFLHKRGVESFASSFVPPLFRIETRKEFEVDIRHIQQELLHSSTEALVATTIAMRDRPDRTSALKMAPFPIQLIGGENDTALPVESMRQVSVEIPTLKLNFIPECGHMGMIEKPEVVARLLLNFHK